MVNLGLMLLFLVLTPLGGRSQGQSSSAQLEAGAVEQTLTVVNYRKGSTEIDFQGTSLMPRAEGKARVRTKEGYAEIDARFKRLEPATKFGSEYLTYVLWAVSTEGRVANLGEVLLDGGKADVKVTAELQAFGMAVTAEPYFAVSKPSNVVVLLNKPRKDTRGTIFAAGGKMELLERGYYQKMINPLMLTLDRKVPLELYQARSAMEIAKASGAEEYAPQALQKASVSLQNAENNLAGRQDKKRIVVTAREAAQFAEDARALSMKRQEQEREAERQRQVVEAQAQQKAEAVRRAQAESAQAQAEAERAQAEAQRARAQAGQEAAESERLKAELAAARAAQERAQAEAARAKAMIQEEKARRDAQRAEELRLQAEREKAELRANLFRQFSMILDTRDTERGLVVNMSDVLFDTAKYTLRPLAREKLARLAGIVLAHPGLRLEAEGHTDSVGSEEYNQTLSERRADSVRSYLIQQGLPREAISSVGRNFSMPVASNDSAEGRQQNRRVELIVSGEVIGTSIGSSASR